MVTPKREEILRRAREMSIERAVVSGLPSITPTEQELKETGVWEEAKLDLMRVDQDQISQQRQYVDEMARELGLEIVTKKEFKQLQEPPKPKTLYKVSAHSRVSVYLDDLWQNVLAKEKRKMPVVDVRKPKRKRAFKARLPSVKDLEKKLAPKPKRKPKRLHVTRSAKTSRKLVGFVFEDDVWGVKPPKRRRRKR